MVVKILATLCFQKKILLAMRLLHFWFAMTIHQWNFVCLDEVFFLSNIPVKAE